LTRAASTGEQDGGVPRGRGRPPYKAAEMEPTIKRSLPDGRGSSTTELLCGERRLRRLVIHSSGSAINNQEIDDGTSLRREKDLDGTLHLFQIDKGLAASDQRPDHAARELHMNMTPQGRVTCCASQSRTFRRAALKIRS